MAFNNVMHNGFQNTETHLGMGCNPEHSDRCIRNIRESSGGRRNTGTGSGQDNFFHIRTVTRTHLALTSSRPGHTRVSAIFSHL